MGCASSKQVVESADVYHPPPASIAYFNIDTIKEPWLITTATKTAEYEKENHVPLPVVEKVDGQGLTSPKPWSEVSKALEDLKPTLLMSPMRAPKTETPPAPPAKDGSRKVPAAETVTKSPPPRSSSLPATLPAGLRPVSQNSFILRDRQEREKRNSTGNEEDPARLWRRDPLHGLPEKCPPGGAEDVVVYTTTVRAVRRTFDDCEAMRQLLEGHLMGEMDIDERDISLHGEYLKELKELVGDEATGVPRLFVLGRYVGGVQAVEELNESGRLAAMLRLVARRKKLGAASSPSPTRRKGCSGCGGMRFVPCLACNGSCKVLVEGKKETIRCGECNENGLVKCPRCN